MTSRSATGRPTDPHPPAGEQRPPVPQATERSLVPPAARARVRRAAVPLAEALGRMGLTPNALTVVGFLGVCGSAVLAGAQAWLVAGIVSLAFAAFDLLDGSLARATGRVSRFGGFLDSTLDRAGEGVLYAGIAAGCVAAGQGALAVLAALALNAAFLVSYTRARAEGLGFAGDVGIAPRAERVVIMGIGLLATGIAGGVTVPALPGAPLTVVSTGGILFTNVAGAPWLAGALGLLFVLSSITVIQRIGYVRTQSHQSEG
jgi:CDP-diacylglycerol---glycerol-3-phosphate 3-phosphatidyltransferase